MRFEVGDVVILLFAHDPEAQKYVGGEYTIIGIHPFFHPAFSGGVGYTLDIPKSSDGREWITAAGALRKKKPPEQLSDWDTIHKITGYRPKELVRV